MPCVWESQESWWDGFAFSPALPAKDIFPDCRWPAILVAHGAGAVPCQCCTAPWWWKQLSTSPSWSPPAQGWGAAFPSSPGCSSLACQLLLGQGCTDHPIAQGASGKEGAKRRGILGRGLALLQQHSGPLHIQEKGQSSTIFALQAEPQSWFFIYGPLPPPCCASVVSSGSSNPDHAGPKLTLTDSSSSAGPRQPAGCSLEPHSLHLWPPRPLMLEWHAGLL